jgi:hypothetical protein
MIFNALGEKKGFVKPLADHAAFPRNAKSPAPDIGADRMAADAMVERHRAAKRAAISPRSKDGDPMGLGGTMGPRGLTEARSQSLDAFKRAIEIDLLDSGQLTVGLQGNGSGMSADQHRPGLGFVRDNPGMLSAVLTDLVEARRSLHEATTILHVLHTHYRLETS